MPDIVCPLYNEYHETLRWTFTEPLGTCIYNTFDQISFIIGWLSVASWTFALLPQIITNCKNKAAESQSFWFWILWLIGDVCNFAGCMLTRNLVTNIALALVYLTFTAFACLQFIWYEYLLKRYSFQKQQKAYQDIHPLFPINQTSSSYSPRSRYSAPIKDGLWGTPQFAKQYHSKSGHISPKLRKTLEIVARSPRMFAVTSQLTLEVRREYEALQAKRRKEQSHLFSFDGDSDSSTSYSSSHYSEERTYSDKVNKTVKIYRSDSGLTPKPETTDHTPSIASAHSVLSTNATDSALLMTNNNPNYGAMSTIMSTLTSMSTTVVMLCGLNTMYSNGEYEHSTQRVLLHNMPTTVHTNASVLVMIGMILGWFSSLIYISSRIPQLRLMVHTKAVAGINPLFFLLTFCGNLTQCLSMLINKQIYTNQSDLFSKLPWLVSSGVCIFQDGLILFLLWLYNKDPQAMAAKHMSRSKGVMMPSPHYLVQKPEHNKRKMRNKKKKEMNRTDYDKAYFEYKYGDGFTINAVKRENNHLLTIMHTV